MRENIGAIPEVCFHDTIFSCCVQFLLCELATLSCVRYVNFTKFTSSIDCIVLKKRINKHLQIKDKYFQSRSFSGVISVQNDGLWSSEIKARICTKRSFETTRVRCFVYDKNPRYHFTISSYNGHRAQWISFVLVNKPKLIKATAILEKHRSDCKMVNDNEKEFLIFTRLLRLSIFDANWDVKAIFFGPVVWLTSGLKYSTIKLVRERVTCPTTEKTRYLWYSPTCFNLLNLYVISTVLF